MVGMDSPCHAGSERKYKQVLVRKAEGRFGGVAVGEDKAQGAKEGERKRDEEILDEAWKRQAGDADITDK